MSDEARVPDPHDEDAEAWKPRSGPMDWSERTASEVGDMTVDDGAEEALALHDSINDDEHLASTVFCPDLREMR